MEQITTDARMEEMMRAPMAKDLFCRWIEDSHDTFIGVQLDDGRCLTVHKDIALPEITVLFAGDAGRFQDTVEVCGMYDNQTRELRFASSRLAPLVDGLSEAERWTGGEENGRVYEEISRYAQAAVAQRGYRFKDRLDAQYAPLRQTAQVCLAAMTEYASVLAAGGEDGFVLDTRDLAEEMLRFWRDPVYETCERDYQRLEQRYLERFDRAVSAARSGQMPVFSSEQAASIFQGLALHAEEVTQNDDAFSVWECCRLARRLSQEYPKKSALFKGNFTPDYGERFTNFGSQDQNRLQAGWLFDRPVLLFNRPIPEDSVPDGWHCCHLAGRNLRHADMLLKEAPEKDYLGTVLSPYVLIRSAYQSRQLKGQFMIEGGECSLEEFCDRYHLPEPDLSGIFPEEQTAKMMGMGGM